MHHVAVQPQHGKRQARQPSAVQGSKAGACMRSRQVEWDQFSRCHKSAEPAEFTHRNLDLFCKLLQPTRAALQHAPPRSLQGFMGGAVRLELRCGEMRASNPQGASDLLSLRSRCKVHGVKAVYANAVDPAQHRSQHSGRTCSFSRCPSSASMRHRSSRCSVLPALRSTPSRDST